MKTGYVLVNMRQVGEAAYRLTMTACESLLSVDACLSGSFSHAAMD